jgi:subtilisin
MRLRKTLLLLASAGIILVACKKEKDNSSTDPEECVDGNATGSGAVIEGRYIVSYSSSAMNGRAMSGDNINRVSADVLSHNNIAATALKGSFTISNGGFIADLSLPEKAKLESDPSIQLIEPDRIIKLSTCFTVAEPRLLTWNIKRVGYGNGIGKTAWIIDTGIDFDHPDLAVNTSKSRSFISGVATADDDNGHGTHVAGIIGGKNNTVGVLGVASGATLIALKVLDKDGEGTLSAIIQALSYINQNASAGDVVNMSLGEDVNSPTLNSAVQNTASRGLYIAIAAGNDHIAAREVSPANANGSNIFTVSAIDSTDVFASFSNYGNDVVDYAAPGVRILSTFSNGRYAYLSGTSMAAPHMAGILLLRGKNFTISGTAKNDPDGTPDPIAHY